VQAVALNRSPSGKHDLVIRYRVDWAEWSASQLLSGRENELPAKAAQAAANVDLAPLDVRIINRQDADRILRSCNGLLSAAIRALTPPFYRRPTNVRWDARAGAPILRSLGAFRIPKTNVCAPISIW